MDRSIITAGATLIISTFLILLVFFILSTPVTEILTGFDDADAGTTSNTKMNEYLPDIETAFWLGMSIAIVTPAVIFVFWVFHREPDWYYRRKRY